MPVQNIFSIAYIYFFDCANKSNTNLIVWVSSSSLLACLEALQVV